MFNTKKYQHKWYIENKERLIKKASNWGKINIEKRKKIRHKWYKENKEQSYLASRNWIKKNPNKRKEYNLRWLSNPDNKLKAKNLGFLYRKRNAKKRNLKQKIYRMNNLIKCKIIDKKSKLKKKYGLSIEEYEELLLQQLSVCAICKQTEKCRSKLVIDHCHKSNKIRGLLCSNCNLALGHFKDDISLLKSAINYLS